MYTKTHDFFYTYEPSQNYPIRIEIVELVSELRG